MLVSVLSIAGGLMILTAGADALVRGSSSLARRVGLSPLVIGLTVVAIGTSLPELLVSLGAALRGSGDVALGNVIGSNISNVGLILGTAALVRAIGVQAQIIRIDAPILVVCSLVLAGMTIDGQLGRIDGVLLVTGIIAYVPFSVWAARKEESGVQDEFDEGLPQKHGWLADVGFLVGGLVGLLVGAHFLVEGAVYVAGTFGVSQLVIGLTIVAVGTSLPELATSLTAALRGEGDIAIGNAIGSSIFNILAILGVTVTVQPLSTAQVSYVDLAVMTGLALAVIPLMRTGFSLSRREGAFLLAAYLTYVGYLVV